MAKILVLDDDPGTRHFLRDILQKLLGHEMEKASCLPKAIEIASEKQFGLIFMDQYLQDGTAVDFCKRLSKLKLADKTHKWIITGEKPLESNIRSWSQLGIQGHLVKPFSIDSIISVVNQCSKSARS